MIFVVETNVVYTFMHLDAFRYISFTFMHS